jgi:hypothetical protein
MNCDDSSRDVRDELAKFLNEPAVQQEDDMSDASVVFADDMSTKSNESSQMGFNSLLLRRTKGLRRARWGVSSRQLFNDTEVKALSSVENASTRRMLAECKVAIIQTILLQSSTNRTPQRVAESEWRQSFLKVLPTRHPNE